MTRLSSANNTDLALKLVFFAALACLLTYLMYQLKTLIFVLLFAITLASAITPLAEAGEKRKIPRLFTVLAIYVAGVACYGTLAALLAPALHEQWHKLSGSLPVYLDNMNRWYQGAIDVAGNNSDALVPSAETLRNIGVRLLHQTLGMTAGFFGLILNAVLTLFLAGYFVVSADKLWDCVFNLIPHQSRTSVRDLIHPLASRIGGYVRGQLLVALSVAAFFAIGFSVIGIKYALVLGLLAGLLNLVPYVGSFIACVFAVVIALNQSAILAGAALLLYVIEQWVESTFLVPFFVGRQASLHPLIVLFAIICGASLMGIAGALISVPIASVLVYLVEEFWIKRSSGMHPPADGKRQVPSSIHEPSIH